MREPTARDIRQGETMADPLASTGLAPNDPGIDIEGLFGDITLAWNKLK
jgi:hypothetical protein